MPEYLAPGVYVEETNFRAKSIEGVGTTTTGFVGAARYGPIAGEPELLTSFSQFERIYGGIDPLRYDSADRVNYLAYAVRAFFDNGGARLYVARTFSTTDSADSELPLKDFTAKATIPAPSADIGRAEDAAKTATRKVVEMLSEAGKTIATVEEELVALKALADKQEPKWNAVINRIESQLRATDPAQTAPIASARAGLDTAKAAVESAYGGGKREDADANTTLPTIISEINAARDAATGSAEKLRADAKVLTEEADKIVDRPAAEQETAATDVVDKAVALIAMVEGSKTESRSTTQKITNAASKAKAEYKAALDSATTFWHARFPGEAGNIRITVSGRLSENVLVSNASKLSVGLQNGDLVLIKPENQPEALYSATQDRNGWQFQSTVGSTPIPLTSLTSAAQIYPLQISVIAELPGKFAQSLNWNELTVSRLANRARNSANTVFGKTIVNRLQSLETPIVLELPDNWNPAAIADSLLNLNNKAQFVKEKLKTEVYLLAGGTDGVEPTAASYEGRENTQTGIKSGLRSLEDLEEISIIAAPGSSHGWGARQADIQTISQHVISHCDRLRYRVAVLDSPENVATSGVREYRGGLDTTRAALYYPWITVVDPLSNQQINLPPSGFVAGIYARNDVEIGVHKAPANEVVRGAVGLETTINKAQQDILNPSGINCIRFFEGRGIRVWGARTISSDPEWKYLNIRRYFAYLEASIDKATQWSVFQPNGERLWENVRRSVEGFLENEWREGHLAGSKLEQAFFVRCDRSTMTQNDLDNGRLICLIGVAPLYPAEFVIFRIGQWTADRR